MSIVSDIITAHLPGKRKTTPTETEPTPVNFNGVFSHLRFYTETNPTDKISKILVRN